MLDPLPCRVFCPTLIGLTISIIGPRLRRVKSPPLGARLAQIPLGRKEHNGRVDRSHRTDDEEFYLPFLGQAQTEEGWLRKGAGWVYYYNLERPHDGKGMERRPSFRVLRELGYDLPEEFALSPPVVLDRIKADWALSWALGVMISWSITPPSC